MRPFELLFAVTLFLLALSSGVLFYVTQDKPIKLDLNGEYEPLQGGSDNDTLKRDDPFDILEPEDMMDGHPLNERIFWKEMRMRKLYLTIAIGLVTLIDTVDFGYSLTAGNTIESAERASSILRVLFDLSLAIFSARLIPEDGADAHWEGLIYIAFLASSAFSLRAISLVLPSHPATLKWTTALVTAFATVDDISNGFEWASVALLLATTVISVNTPRGPPLHFPPERLYSPKMLESAAPRSPDNVCTIVQSTIWQYTLFSYTTAVARLGFISDSLEVRDLPIVPASYRAANLFAIMRNATFEDAQLAEKASMERRANGLQTKTVGWWWQRNGRYPLLARLVRTNKTPLIIEVALAAITACLYYAPAWFLQQLVQYLEENPDRTNKSWGWVYVAGLFFGNAINHILTGQLWSVATTTLQIALKVQLNTILFSKTLLRKDVATSSSSLSKPAETNGVLLDADASAVIRTEEPVGTMHESAEAENISTVKSDEDEDFSSKSQIMTLMTTDVDRVSDFSWHLFSLIDAPIEICIGTFYLYHLLGSSCFWGLLVTCLFLPLSHLASKFVVVAQDNLMKSRDERVSLMNEILGGIRMLKFMAWERNFEARVLKVRAKELKYQRRNYWIEVCFNAVWMASPVLVTVVAFFHYTVIRGEHLSPSIAFTSLSVFNELKFALNALPETFINMLQGFVSVRRIEKYLASPEVLLVRPLDADELANIKIALSNATITWPQDRNDSRSRTTGSSIGATPSFAGKFVLNDLSLNIPMRELTLICGKLGSGKTLLLLALLGEADLLSGQIICPRSPPEALAAYATLQYIPELEWIVAGLCAYVPQTAWLQNASIKDNILFNLPFDAKRYQDTLEACALVSDLKIIEDGDDAEIGERGVNLSGGQKARVSLARAVYSRASIILLDDVLSAVDAHTARHIYDECIKGPLMEERTVILVSHHVQLCAPGASYVVALDNGRLQYAGSREAFLKHEFSADLGKTLERNAVEDNVAEQATEDEPDVISRNGSVTPDSTVAASGLQTPVQKKAPRKLIDEESRAVGRVARDIWLTYLRACGTWIYWTLFAFVFVIAALSPVLENGWLSYWSAASDAEIHPLKFVGIYAAINLFGIIVSTVRWFILYEGSITASTALYKRLLEAVLFAKIRFHDTISRGRLLNRFGKDFETIDSNQADHFGRTVIYSMNVAVTLVTVTVIGGPLFLIAAIILGFLYFQAAKIYGQTSRDLRRLDSVTRSPLYSMYGETISGVAILRAFGAPTKFLRDMHQHVDTNTNPFFWMWSLNRWLSIRFNLLSCGVVGATAASVLVNKNVSASMAGFALAFASSITSDLLFMVRRFVGLEQSMVALERINEYSVLPSEAPEFVEPRPPKLWPHEGAIEVRDLVIRYAPDLPDVLHKISFRAEPKAKIGIIGRTGGGKSTLALSFFRFVEATEGSIVIDGIDLASIGLADLRSKITIIPQDPTILSGTLRSTLDVFEEYDDVDIFEALRRVHLIPSEDTPAEAVGLLNANVFRNLDSPVNEGGDNFSAGEKQLMCMARAILKKSKVLLMDEATASVDYATDELISKTIRREFADSTILTIAHRLRSVVDYDKVLVLDQGRIVEFEQPATLLSNPSSVFFGLCKATGHREFGELQLRAAAAAGTDSL